jgi:hypothetical protein
MTTPVQTVVKFYESQKADRDPWDPLFQEVADYMLPRRAAFTTPVVKGHNRDDYLYDDMGPWALEQFANGLHSMLTSPLSRWFGLQIKQETLRENTSVIEWKDHATEVLYDQFNSSISSFHPSVQEVYSDVGAFGYGVGYSEWNDDDSAVLYQARFPGEIYLVEDLYGRVRGVVRKYKLKIHQFVEAFGIDRLPVQERQRYTEKGEGKDFEIIHAVLPRAHPIMQKFNIAERYSYGSVRVCKDMKDGPLAVGGYRSFPFHIARWGKRAGEVYASSPAITALPSVRRANAIQLDLIKIANRWADPPIQAPDDESLAPYDLSPGSTNYYRPGSGDRIEAVAGVLGDPQWAQRVLEDTHGSIMRMFFVEAFLTTADSNGQNVKATFVMQRRDERFRQLAAMLSRMEREFLGSIIERTFDLCQENGLIAPAPIDEQVTLEIEYLSPIVRAQRSEQLDGLFPLIELAAIGAQSDPTVMEVFEWDNIMRDAGEEVYALRESWFKSREQIEAIRQAAAEQQQMAQQAEMAQQLGGALKDVSSAELATRS